VRVIYIGSGEIGLPALEWLLRHEEVVGVVAQPDKPAGRKQVLTPPATKRLAEEHGVPVLQPRRLRAPEAVAEIAALRPELIVVMAYGQILPKSLLDLPAKGCLNLHASLLPAHRGAAPIQAAILAGDRESGITVMWMDEGLDTGDILLTHDLPVAADETGGSLHDRLGEAAPAALAEAVGMIRSGTAPRRPQDDALATYAPKLSRESGVIDWSASSVEIDRTIRAMNPWPAASTTLPAAGEGKRPLTLKIFSAGIVPETAPPRSDAPPGSVLQADRSGIAVQTGSGVLLLREVQLEGKKRMPAGDFLLGTPLPVGTRFTPPLSADSADSA